jgi:hypothetical protein
MSQAPEVNPFEHAEIVDLPQHGVNDEEPYGAKSSTTVTESVTVTDDEGVVSHDSVSVTTEDPDADVYVMPSIEEDWKYDTLEFAGHTFGVRLPKQQALTAISMSTGSSVPWQTQQHMVSMFVRQHLSEQSWLFLMTQLMTPDDTEFIDRSFNDLLQLLIEKGYERINADLEAQAAVAQGNGPRLLKPKKN